MNAKGGYSQFGEHYLIDKVFGRRKRRGYAVDVGACDGISLSNTKQLEERGWSVLCIEPNPVYARKLRKNRSTIMTLACGKRNLNDQNFSVYEVQPGNFEAYSSLKPEKKAGKPKNKIKVRVRTLDWCLEQVKFPRLDLVSIDVEGTEQDVLDGFDIDRWKPKMVILEDWVGGRLRPWMCHHGYYVMRRLGVNEAFLRA